MKDDTDNGVDLSIDRYHLLQLMYIAYPKMIISCKKTRGIKDLWYWS